MFTRITWLFLLLSGITLFSASLIIEGAVLSAFLPSVMAAFALAAALEVTKATVVILRRADIDRRRILLSSSLLRLALIGFSALCSLMFLAEKMHAPHRDSLRQAGLTQLEEALSAQQQRLIQQREQRLLQHQQQHQQREEHSLSTLHQQHRARIQALEKQLNEEMDNVVNGIFAGPRYHAIEQRLEAAKARYRADEATQLQTLDEQDRQFRAGIEQRHHQQWQQALKDYEQRYQQMLYTDLDQDPRAQHPMVQKILEVLATVMPNPPTTVAFVMVFSLSLALLMEMGIYVAFDTLALAWGRVFAVAHAADVDMETRKIKTRQEQQAEAMEDEHLRHKVRSRRARSEQIMQDSIDDLKTQQDPA